MMGLKSRADGNMSLILTHLQHPYSVQNAAKAIREYIGRHNPRIYQLCNPRFPSLIEGGETFQSYSGEVPGDLKLKLQEDNGNGNQIILAGGLEGQCLEITFRQLRNLGIRPKVLFEGISPEIGNYKRLFRQYVYAGKYTFD